VIDSDPSLHHFSLGRCDLPLAPLLGTVNASRLFTALCPNERVSNASPGARFFVQAKDRDMRDFRDAKAMARTLRAALAAKGLKITISQSLELIAELFGVADWNTLAAAIRGDRTVPRDDASPSPPPRAETVSGGGILFSRALELTLHRALACANQRYHEYATLEHLLLALTDEADASAVMMAATSILPR
jgi:Glyoxalase superfamily protein/Clp amino terminal domain, pathogenicity island component